MRWRLTGLTNECLGFRVEHSVPQSKFVPRSTQFTVDQLVTNPILSMCRNIIWTPIRRQYGQLSVGEAFTQIYRKLWGRIEGNKFFSGRGSLDKFAIPEVSVSVSNSPILLKMNCRMESSV